MGPGVGAPNVLRMDDLLLKGAAVAAVVVVFAGGVWLAVPEEAPTVRTALGLGMGFAALAPIGMLLCGLHLRKRELRAQGLMRLLDRNPELTAADLLRSSDLSAATLECAVRDLNSSGARHVVWDHERGLLQDGRLRMKRLHVETCRSCGVKISLDVPLNEAATARCPSCGSTLDAREIDEEKHAVMAELREEAKPRLAPRPRFSVPLFLVLLVVCWPLALLYGAKCWRPADCEEPSGCA
jgi:predicted RNA-binding Zn-ribbon protein involved in translation (DUF1610 family)